MRIWPPCACGVVAAAGRGCWREDCESRATRPRTIRQFSDKDSALPLKGEASVALRIGFIGLGIMGSGMAANLQTHGCEVTVLNR